MLHKNSLLIYISDCSFSSVVFILITTIWFQEVSLLKKPLCPHSYNFKYNHKWTFAQQTSPSQIWPQYTLCFANWEPRPGHSTASVRFFPRWSPTALLLSLWEYHISFSWTDTLYQVQTSMQHNAETESFPKHSPICFALELKRRCTVVNQREWDSYWVSNQPLGITPHDNLHSNRTETVWTKTKTCIRISELSVTSMVPKISSPV